MNTKNYKDVAKLFKALSAPIRLYILSLLSYKDICACKLLSSLSISQPTLSHHMKILINSGLVLGYKKATWMHYTINKDAIDEIQQIINLIRAGQFDGQSCFRKNVKVKNKCRGIKL
jgi:ArsR family transcriptional regulator